MIFSNAQSADKHLRSLICLDVSPCPFLENADLSPMLPCNGGVSPHGLDHFFVKEFLECSSQGYGGVGDSTCAKPIVHPISSFSCRDLPIAPRMRQQ
jgi:hypothetical protein